MVTVNVQLFELPEESAYVYVTGVTPMGKRSPELEEDDTNSTVPELSDTTGGSQVT